MTGALVPKHERKTGHRLIWNHACSCPRRLAIVIPAPACVIGRRRRIPSQDETEKGWQGGQRSAVARPCREAPIWRGDCRSAISAREKEREPASSGMSPMTNPRKCSGYTGRRRPTADLASKPRMGRRPVRQENTKTLAGAAASCRLVRCLHRRMTGTRRALLNCCRFPLSATPQGWYRGDRFHLRGGHL